MNVLDAARVDQDINVTWVAPTYCDVRLGFEVTAYVYVR
jgi:pyrroloquinoline quinone biosynthesis protein A